MLFSHRSRTTVALGLSHAKTVVITLRQHLVRLRRLERTLHVVETRQQGRTYPSAHRGNRHRRSLLAVNRLVIPVSTDTPGEVALCPRGTGLGRTVLRPPSRQVSPLCARHRPPSILPVIPQRSRRKCRFRPTGPFQATEWSSHGMVQETLYQPHGSRCMCSQKLLRALASLVHGSTRYWSLRIAVLVLSSLRYPDFGPVADAKDGITICSCRYAGLL